MGWQAAFTMGALLLLFGSGVLEVQAWILRWARRSGW